MNLIILASGMGKRLDKKIPKCLVKIENKTLLENILNISHNFKKIIVVGGYKVNLIKKIIKKQNKNNIVLIENKDFKNSNMVESFFKAYKSIDNDCIISYSDIIFHPKLIDKMIKYKFNHLLLNSNWQKVWSQRMPKEKIKLDAEDIKTKKYNILSIGSKIKKKLPKYQFMGLIRINQNSLKKIKLFYKKLNNRNIDFTSFINLLIENKISYFKFQQTKKYWFEIDTKKDLSVAKKFFIKK